MYSTSLAANNIREVPVDFLSGKQFVKLSLATNPIQSLPEVQTGPVMVPPEQYRVDGLFLQQTDVQALPKWITETGFCSRVRLHVGGIPFCVSSGNSTCSSDADVAPHCADVVRSDEFLHFPIQEHEQRRQP